MKNQALFSSKDKSKKLKCRLLQFLFGALRVKYKLLSPIFCICETDKHIKLLTSFTADLLRLNLADFTAASLIFSSWHSLRCIVFPNNIFLNSPIL